MNKKEIIQKWLAFIKDCHRGISHREAERQKKKINHFRKSKKQQQKLMFLIDVSHFQHELSMFQGLSSVVINN